MNLNLVLCGLALVAPAARAQEPGAAERAGRVAALLELSASEYANAVRDGAVVDSAEWTETRSFIDEAARELARLESDHGPAASAARGAPSLAVLREAVREKRPPAELRDLVARATADLSAAWGAVVVRLPDRTPSAASGADVYRTRCASCHGSAGRGDGPAAPGLDPAPADLASRDRGMAATPILDFQILTYGIPETAMQGFADVLTAEERWDVVAYVQTLRFDRERVAEGRRLALGDGAPIARRVAAWGGLGGSGSLSDLELADRVRNVWEDGTGEAPDPEDATAVVAYLRSLLGAPDPDLPPPDRSAELDATFAAIDSLAGRAVRLGAAGDLEGAGGVAVDAYMIFERLEAELGSRAPAAVRSIESGFARFRGALGTPDAAGARTDLTVELEAAREVLARRDSRLALGVQSFVIIVREGFEAILIVGALIAFLLKTGHTDRRRMVQGGAVAAVAASLLTAFLLEGLFRAVPARQEVLEGVTMLVAVAVLFSVSYWLLSKLDKRRWTEYLRSQMQTALGAGSGTALAGVAFLAVYREGFETVLFYKALVGFTGDRMAPIAAGFVAGCLALALIYVLFTRFGVRMPFRPFFAITSGVLYYMAFVFAGKGVSELQAAGVVSLTPVRGFPPLPLLGLYPTAETLGAQALLALLLVGALIVTFRPAAAAQSWSRSRV
ncbi:MAG: FTR1 family protein [Gemmatimonadota bacterium]